MKRSQRSLILIIILVFGLVAAEYVRERIVFLAGTRKLEHAYWDIRPGMTRDQVVKELGSPTFADTEPGHDDFYWSAARFEGFLLKRLKMEHYTITVSFGQDDRVADVSSAMN